MTGVKSPLAPVFVILVSRIYLELPSLSVILLYRGTIPTKGGTTYFGREKSK
jgi:hypothetical protein